MPRKREWTLEDECRWLIRHWFKASKETEGVYRGKDRKIESYCDGHAEGLAVGYWVAAEHLKAALARGRKRRRPRRSAGRGAK